MSKCYFFFVSLLRNLLMIFFKRTEISKNSRKYLIFITGIGGFMTTTGSGAYSILVYRPSGAIGTVTVQDVETAATGANPPAKTINAATSTKATVSVFGHVASNGTAVLNGPTPTTFSPTQDGSAVGSGSYYCLLYGLAQAEGAGSDVTADGSDGGVVNILVTAYLEVEP